MCRCLCEKIQRPLTIWLRPSIFLICASAVRPLQPLKAVACEGSTSNSDYLVGGLPQLAALELLCVLRLSLNNEFHNLRADRVTQQIVAKIHPTDFAHHFHGDNHSSSAQESRRISKAPRSTFKRYNSL
jgi:hypothetical protein